MGFLDPKPPTRAELDATILEQVAPVEDQVVAVESLVTRVQTLNPIRKPMSMADVTISNQNALGMTKAGSVLSATTPGTTGLFWVPLWRARTFSASAKIKATKATAGSLSVFGLSNTKPGEAATEAATWFGVGYVQGVGVVLRRSNATGSDQILVADSAITDGTEYTITLVFDAAVHPLGVPGEFTLQATITDADGFITARAESFANLNWFSQTTGTFAVRTNVANAVTGLQLSQTLGAELVAPAAIRSGAYSPSLSTERTSIRIPAKPNGRLVIACHGRGVNNVSMFNPTQYDHTWRLLLAQGFTIAMPNMGGSLWGNATAQGFIAELRDVLCAEYNLDRQVFLWGSSMGGGAALTAIAKGTFGPEGVAAAYLAQPVCDIAAVYADNTTQFPEIPTVYPTTPEMDAYSPIKLPTENYAGVPLLFVASAADGTVNKAENTDAMRTKLGNVTRHALITATGAHEDPSEFRATDCVSWFQSVL